MGRNFGQKCLFKKKELFINDIVYVRQQTDFFSNQTLYLLSACYERCHVCCSDEKLYPAKVVAVS